jgi:Fe-S oxidoreductase
MKRALPNFSNEPLDVWWYKNKKNNKSTNDISVCVICDPYTQYYDVEAGRSFLTFLQACKINVNVIFSKYSIRALISNGLLDDAEYAINETIDQLKSVSTSNFITGIEVSEVLTWRDDIKDLLDDNLPKVIFFEELVLELNKLGALPRMKEINSKVWIHMHCHQKALTDSLTLKQALSLIQGINMEIIDSGCCGMAGDFGYKHPELSTKIAQQSLNKAISKIKNDDILIATGTSCRNQLSDVFQNNSLHLSQLFLKTINNENIKR